MNYAPNTAVDKQLLSHSHALVRKTTALLRRSSGPIDDQSRCAKASQAVTARQSRTAA